MMLWKTKVWRGQKQIQSLMSLNSERSATLLSTAALYAVKEMTAASAWL